MFSDMPLQTRTPSTPFYLLFCMLDKDLNADRFFYHKKVTMQIQRRGLNAEINRELEQRL